jgi:hypothetical protein
MTPNTYLSWGMGVESTAILVRWILDPSSRPCELEDLVVVVAQTGDEHEDTKRACEYYILPLLRKHRIRLVQVARGGSKEADGIVMLSDTRAPYAMHTAGAYKLSDELLAAGTVPQFAGAHRCALKFKAFVIDTWLALELAGKPHAHAWGYNADETSRVDACEAAIAASPLAYSMAFGFNVDEGERVARSREFDGKGRPTRIGLYPLVDWAWPREACIDYLWRELGVRWMKSACYFCPFNAELAKATPLGLERLLSDPVAASRALLLERMSLSMNPRGTLFRTKSLHEIVINHAIEGGLDDDTFNPAYRAIKVHRAELDVATWALYRVRRVYTSKGKAHRSVERMNEGAREPITRALGVMAQVKGHALDCLDAANIERFTVEECEPDVYPTREEFWVAAPATVETKSRYGLPWFEERWAEVDAAREAR